MLAGADGFGTGFAADRNKAALVERVVGQVIASNVIPYILRAPVSQWIKFGQDCTWARKRGVILNHWNTGTGAGTLVFALTADPGIKSVQLFTQRIDFT